MNATLGLAVLGSPLVFLGMGSLFARVSIPLGYALIVAGLVSLGVSVSASPRRSQLPWAEGAGLLALGLTAVGMGLEAWFAWAVVGMGVAFVGYGLLLRADRHWAHPWHLPHPRWVQVVPRHR